MLTYFDKNKNIKKINETFTLLVAQGGFLQILNMGAQEEIKIYTIPYYCPPNVFHFFDS
jgi:hypothetical protein